MPFEYKTVGGPERGKRKRGCRTASERVAAAMEELIRAEAAEGWEYVRTDLVPVEERTSWLARRQTVHCAVLVFRRERGAEPEPRAALGRKAQRLFGKGAGAQAAPAEPHVETPGRAPLPRAPAEEAPIAPLQRDVPPGAPQPGAADRPPTPEQLAAAIFGGRPPGQESGAPQAPGAGEERPQQSGLFTRMRGGPQAPRFPPRDE
jgi:hypothetical protein